MPRTLALIVGLVAAGAGFAAPAWPSPQPMLPPSQGDLPCTAHWLDILPPTSDTYQHFSEWSPDGMALAFETSDTTEMGGSFWTHIAALYDYRTGTVRQLTPECSAPSPYVAFGSWSPDGHWIVWYGFSRERDISPSKPAIGIVNPRGQLRCLLDVRRLGHLTTATQDALPSGGGWSADSGYLLWAVGPEEAPEAFGTVTVEGKTPLVASQDWLKAVLHIRGRGHFYLLALQWSPTTPRFAAVLTLTNPGALRGSGSTCPPALEGRLVVLLADPSGDNVLWRGIGRELHSEDIQCLWAPDGRSLAVSGSDWTQVLEAQSLRVRAVAPGRLLGWIGSSRLLIMSPGTHPGMVRGTWSIFEVDTHTQRAIVTLGLEEEAQRVGLTHMLLTTSRPSAARADQPTVLPPPAVSPTAPCSLYLIDLLGNEWRLLAGGADHYLASPSRDGRFIAWLDKERPPKAGGDSLHLLDRRTGRQRMVLMRTKGHPGPQMEWSRTSDRLFVVPADSPRRLLMLDCDE